MASRLELQTILERVLGSPYVYFQPPNSIEMNYPAIVYGLDKIENSYANDGVYSSKKKYQITVIDEDPDSVVVDRVAVLPTCRFIRHFESDNLNHDVFTLHY